MPLKLPKQRIGTYTFESVRRMFGTGYGLSEICPQSECLQPALQILLLRNPPSICSMGFLVLVLGLLLLFSFFFIFFYKLTTVPDYLHTMQYVCLLERPSFCRIMPDVLCSKIPTLMLQPPLSLFVFIVISCHAAFLYQCLHCFGIRSRRTRGMHTT